jgi:hypothetical protein
MEQMKLFGVEIEKKEAKKVLPKIVITDELVRTWDSEKIREYIFEEDEQGRYRERIHDLIRKIGVKNWFVLKGLPIEENSIWINRYVKDSETTLNEQVNKQNNPSWNGIEQQGLYLWENWLPKRIEGMSVTKYVEPKPVMLGNAGKKVKMTIDLGYGWAEGENYWLKEPVENWVVRFEGYGGLCSVGNKMAETPEKVVEEYTADMIKEGYLLENIEVIRSERTPEKLAEMRKRIAERKAYYEKEEKKNFKANGEKQIEEYSKKLKELLRIKFGYPVTIKIFKEGDNNGK